MNTLDWIDGPDPDFNTQADQFNSWVQTHGATHGLSAGQVSDLNGKFGDWADAIPRFKPHRPPPGRP
jgi:hypothetical protein